jgi:predicted negative regulator of RcsB-dependent stress response
MAWVCYKKKDYQKPKKFILAALELWPDGVILDHAGDIFAALGEQEKALAYWQRAAQSSDPELDQKAVLKKLPSPFVHRVKPVQNRKPKADGRKNAPAAPRKKVL